MIYLRRGRGHDEALQRALSIIVMHVVRTVVDEIELSGGPETEDIVNVVHRVSQVLYDGKGRACGE